VGSVGAGPPPTRPAVPRPRCRGSRQTAAHRRGRLLFRAYGLQVMVGHTASRGGVWRCAHGGTDRSAARAKGRDRRLGFFDLLDDRAPELALDKLHAGWLGAPFRGSRVVGPFLVVVRSGR
jgi:hypothetical protein